MVTRSKKGNIVDTNNNPNDPNNGPPIDDIEDDIDEHGNIKGLIDYNNDKKKIKKNKFRKNARSKQNKLGDMALSYMIMNILKNINIPPMIISNNTKRKNIKLKISEKTKKIINEEDDTDDTDDNVDIDDGDVDIDDDVNGSNSDGDDESGDDADEDNESIELSEQSIEMSEDGTNNDENNSDSDDSYNFDEFDEQFMDMEDNMECCEDEDENINYFHNLEKDKKEKLLNEIQKVNEINDLHMPLKFKIYNSDMDLNTKAIAIKSIDKLSEMDVSTGEHSKMDKWINGLISIPFNKYVNLPINNENTIDEKRDYIIKSKSILDKSIYGHNDAKTHILQVIGKWIKNPSSQGNVLALQGPMGNGKTTLVKEGISKAIGRPFSFIALGGQSDSSIFEGHSYTYEGSHWGRIIDILIESKCMNPVIYFDELDKVSDSAKGEEIIHMLTHLTDPSQNTLFQDNYYPGINIDLSKVLFIFSFNDEFKINRILKDRMYVINTKGFNNKEKISICKDYILPELYDTYLFKSKDIIINDEILEYIIDKYTDKEEGVRNFKRCIEGIISKINIYYLTHTDNNDDNDIDLNFKIKNFKLPYTINRSDVDNFIKSNTSSNPPPYMYM